MGRLLVVLFLFQYLADCSKTICNGDHLDRIVYASLEGVKYTFHQSKFEGLESSKLYQLLFVKGRLSSSDLEASIVNLDDVEGVRGETFPGIYHAIESGKRILLQSMGHEDLEALGLEFEILLPWFPSEKENGYRRYIVTLMGNNFELVEFAKDSSEYIVNRCFPLNATCEVSLSNYEACIISILLFIYQRESGGDVPEDPQYYHIRNVVLPHVVRALDWKFNEKNTLTFHMQPRRYGTIFLGKLRDEIKKYFPRSGCFNSDHNNIEVVSDTGVGKLIQKINEARKRRYQI